jgi:hypothetical protein
MKSMAEIVGPPTSTTHTERHRGHKGPVKTTHETLQFDGLNQD